MSADDRASTLYGLPLERFVPERDALAKALRDDGDRAGADEIKRLAKPTRAAWAVNIAVRERPEAAHELADSARLLVEAQQEALGGGDAAALREAGERARRAVETLVAAAPDSSAATTEKVRSTLHAAAADPDLLAEVTAGRVARDHVASGFGGLATGAAAPPRKRRRAGAELDRGEVGETDRRRAEHAERAAAREAARRREKLRRAKEAEAAAEDAVTAARRALEQVESALRERKGELREAESNLRDARRRRERAER